MSVAAIVLAAGASRRMGRPKPLLPWGESTLLAWEVDQLTRSCVDRIVIVTGARADEVRRSLGAAGRHFLINCLFNPRWPQGRATSLVAGARALLGGGHEAVVVQNVDQPTRHDIVDRLVEELRASGAEAVQPSCGGRAGHPVVLAGRFLPELARARDETRGLRGVLDAHPARPLAMDREPVVLIDLDTPDALAEGRRLLNVAAPA